MLVNKCLSNVEQAAIDAQQIDLEGLGTTENNRAFLINPDNGMHYNVFVEVWRWARRHLKRKHGDKHR